MLSNTPKTDWTSADPIDQSTLNGIEQNIQDLEDSKIELEATKQYDFTDPEAGSDDDVNIQFASDAAIEWNEGDDRFEVTKKIEGIVTDPISVDEGTMTTGSASPVWGTLASSLPKGIYMFSPTVRIVDTTDAPFDRIVRTGLVISDGVNYSNIKYEGDPNTTYYYRRFS